MIHVYSVSRVTDKIRRTIIDLGIEDSINQEIPNLVDLIREDKKSIDKKWREFKLYIQKQEPFDRIYLESITKRTSSHNLKTDEESGMKDCLDYLNKTRVFETTENYFCYNLALKFQKFPNILNIINRKRESLVYKNINKTLKEGERGLLLFGWLHNFDRFFKNSDINYEVCEYNLFDDSLNSKTLKTLDSN